MLKLMSTPQSPSFDRRKITLPPVNTKLLPRCRLTEQLNQCLKSKLTIIAAPAGSGKTELVQQWRSQYPQTKLAWLNLDQTDEGMEDFARYLQQTILEACDDAPIYAQHSPQESLETLEKYFQQAQPELVVCLDNSHFLSPTPARDALLRCVCDPYSKVRWLLLSQQQLDWDFTELQLKDQLQQLSSTELNLTVSEISELASLREHSAENAQAIYDVTQGWIAGVNLSLATHSTQSRNSSQPSQKTIDLFQYLAVSDLPDEVFDLIRAAEICNPINSELADQINQTQSSLRAIDYLQKNCLFIQPLDQQKNWFQIHPLFFIALQKTLSKTPETKRQQQHLYAGQWLIEHQITEQGLEHLLAGKNHELFDLHLTEVTQEWLLNGNLTEINHWCAQVDSDRLFDNTQLLLQYLLSLTLSFRSSEASQTLKTFDEAHQTKPPQLEVARQLLACFTLDTQHQPSEHRDKIRQQLLLKKNKTQMENFVLGTVTNIAALYAYLNYDLKQAAAFANEGLRYHRLANSIHGESYSEFLDASSKFSSGKHSQETITHIESFLRAKHIQRTQPCYVVMCVSIAPLCYELNQHEKSLQYCQYAAADINVETHLEITILFQLTYAKLLHRNGEQTRSEQQLNNMLNHQSTAHSSRAVALVALERLRQGMIDRTPERAINLYQRLKLDELTREKPEEISETEDFQSWGLICVARLFFQFLQNNFDDVQTDLDSLRQLLNEKDNQYIRAIIDVFQIAVLWRRGQKEIVLNELPILMEQLDHQGFYCVLRDYLADLDEILKALKDRMPKHLSPCFEADLRLKPTESDSDSLVALSRSKTPRQLTPLLEPLTKRELVLLADIANGLSNQEISDKRFVAISTVKWHLKNIYAKLNAKHRAQAIARARELGIID